ncbi:MAG: hypothetical protein ABI216_15940 [Devosia sp.]
MTAAVGLLAIWNDIISGAETEFRQWHSGEHMPERMGVPGFRRGRRLFNADARPRWLTLYETESSAVLSSPAYLARLNAPSDWTQAVLPSFAATERMAAQVVGHEGRGHGGVVVAMRLWLPGPADVKSLGVALHRLVEATGALAGVVAAATAAPQQTKERGLRQGGVAPADAVLPLPAERAVTDVYRLEHDITIGDVA